jgi:predicted phage terminase large subunit-like protein
VDARLVSLGKILIRGSLSVLSEGWGSSDQNVYAPDELPEQVQLLRSEYPLRLPVEAGEEDPMGRRPGQPLAPELGKDERWLSQYRKSYLSDPRGGGARAWQALYLCRPGAESGSIVRRDWWRYYDAGVQTDFDLTVISVDAAFKGGENNDFVAVQVWSRKGGDLFLRSSLNRRMEFPETVQAILAARRLFPETRFILIEDKANGSAVIQTLRRQLPGVVPIQPRGGKEARVHAISPAVESGHVFLPRGESWAMELVEQFAAFPRGKHDDMVDAASQCISWLLLQGTGETVQPRWDEAAAFADPGIYAVYG